MDRSSRSHLCLAHVFLSPVGLARPHWCDGCAACAAGWTAFFGLLLRPLRAFWNGHGQPFLFPVWLDLAHVSREDSVRTEGPSIYYVST